MRAAFKKALCLLCSLIILTINIVAFAEVSDRITPEDLPNENRSAAYGYVLNDYINRYGVVSNEHPMGFMGLDGKRPNGLVYADIVNFENNDNPYLVLFISDSPNNVASCHIWGYDEKSEKAYCSAAINKGFEPLKSVTGTYSIGWSGDKRFIVYKELNEQATVYTQYFTVINGETFSYVENPVGVNEAPVMSFNNFAFSSQVDISEYNEALSLFFDKLKNAAADSVTYPDITDTLDDTEYADLEATTNAAATLGNFDILDYTTMEEYESALNEKKDGDKFYLISNVYNLGDEVYYVRFSTDRSFYNYALIRHTDSDVKYQILKVRMDCIPLSDRELKQQKDSHLKSALLYKKAKSSTGSILPTDEPDESAIIDIPEVIDAPKVFDEKVTKPAAYVVAILAVFLIAGLWGYIYTHDD